MASSSSSSSSTSSPTSHFRQLPSHINVDDDYYDEEDRLNHLRMALAEAGRERLDESLDQLLAALARRPRPIDPQLLNDRLVNARWSI